MLTMLRALLLILVSVSSSSWGAALCAQDPPGPIQDPPLTAEEVGRRLEQVQADVGLEAEMRDQLVERLTAARSSIVQADAADAAATGFEDAIAHGAERAAAVREGVDGLLRAIHTDLSDLPDDPKTADVDRILSSARSEVAAVREEVKRKEAVSAAIAERGGLIGAEQAAAREALTAAEAEAKVDRPSGELALRGETLRFAALAVARAARSQLEMLDLEVSSATVRREQADAEREAGLRRAEALDLRVQALAALLESLRERDAKEARATAEAELREAQSKDPALLAIAAHNAELTEQLTKAVADHPRVASLRDMRISQRDQLQATFESTTKQLERSGVRGVGQQIVRDQRRKVPDLVRSTRRVDAEWLARMPGTDAKRFDVSIQRSELSAGLEAFARAALDVDDSDPDPRLPEAVRLLEARVDHLRDLDQAYEKLLEAMRGLETVRREFEAVSGSFTLLLDEWLLWIPTSSPEDLGSPKVLWTGLSWFFAPTAWIAAFGGLVTDAGSATSDWVVFLLAVIVLVAGRRRFRAALEATGARVGDVRVDSFAWTMRAVAWTLLLAVPVPLVLHFLGGRLIAAPEGEIAAALGVGFRRAGTVAVMLIVVWEAIAERGLAEVHLRWPGAGLASARRLLRWAAPVVLAAVLVFDVAQSQSDPAVGASLGGLAFLVAMFAAGAISHGVLRPAGAVVLGSRAANPRSLLSRHPRWWYAFGVGLPVALSILAALGYTYAAENLTGRFARTVALVISITIVQSLAWRWFRIRRGQLAFQQAAKVRASETGDEAQELEAVRSDEQLDLAAFSEQGRQLLRTVVVIVLLVGTWWIWADVLPAFAIFDRLELWPTDAIGPGGTPVTVWITLGDVIVALLTGLFTIAASRNLPGVLEVVVLKNLPIDAGSRYAITTISRYLVLGIGLVAAFQVLGFSWSKVQWLAAAVGVGLGFGLQEIIANFVSGLILLFERPIRVGDTVTVGGIQGIVSRIRIRATTITDWDRMELIVPNKELITGRVQNWTLTNPINRVVVKVGVDLNTDVAQVRQVLIDAALGHPKVLRDPAPIVNLDELGPNALGFTVRCYLPDMSDRLATVHEIHACVLAALREAGIRIASPRLRVQQTPES